MKKVFRVLHITTSLKIGGAEALLVNLAKDTKNDFEIFIIYFYDGPNRALLKDAGIQLYKIDGKLCFYDPLFIFRLYNQIKALKPDIIHTWLWSANFLGSLMGSVLKIPVAISIHSVFNKTSVAKNSFFKSLIDKITIRLSSKIVFVSESTKRLFKQFHKDLPKNKSLVINNGIKVPLMPSYATPQSKYFTIGSVGRFIPLKNHALLIDVFAELSRDFNNIRLMLIGYGPLEELLRQKVLDLNICDKVSFIKTNQPEDYYAQMDCFVLPSDQEGLSISLLEAMSFGVTPIVTSLDGNHDVIKNGVNGLISAPSIYNINAAIQSLIQNTEFNKKLARAARRTVEAEFDFASMSKSYTNLYKDLFAK